MYYYYYYYQISFFSIFSTFSFNCHCEYKIKPFLIFNFVQFMIINYPKIPLSQSNFIFEALTEQSIITASRIAAISTEEILKSDVPFLLSHFCFQSWKSIESISGTFSFSSRKYHCVWSLCTIEVKLL